MLTKLDGNAQAELYNRQKTAAYINLQYVYLHWHLAQRRVLTVTPRPVVVDFGSLEDPVKFNGKQMYPTWLSKMVQAHQQPITAAQKKMMTLAK